MWGQIISHIKGKPCLHTRDHDRMNAFKVRVFSLSRPYLIIAIRGCVLYSSLNIDRCHQFNVALLLVLTEMEMVSNSMFFS